MKTRTLLLSLICMAFSLQAQDVFIDEYTTILEAEPRLAFVNNKLQAAALYALAKNRLVKLPKSRYNSEEGFLVRSGKKSPAVPVTVVHNYKERTYTLHKGKALEVRQKQTPYFATEEQFLTLPHQEHALRIVHDSAKDICYGLKAHYFADFQNAQIERFKKKYAIRFASLEKQKTVNAFAKKCGLREPIAVYEYNEPQEYQEYLSWRTNFNFSTGEESRKILAGNKLVMVINPHESNPALFKAQVYHQLGHILHRDAEKNNNFGVKVTSATKREQEYAADHFMYKQLAKERDFASCVAWFNFLCDSIVATEDTTQADYQADNPESNHPSNWHRAQRCLNMLEKVASRARKPLAQYLETLSLDTATKNLVLAHKTRFFSK